MAAIINVQKLCKSYTMGNTQIDVLRNVTLDINKGEFASIMGPSGSGKSTLLFLIGGLDTPTSGSIKIKDKDLVLMKDKEKSILRRRELGFIFQFYNLVPNLTVEENIMMPVLLDGKKIGRYKESLENIIEDVGLKDRRKHTPRELSGGQQQRVAIARALINSPDIILADEPIGNLDSKTGTEIMELLKKINMNDGKTIVQVTHSEEASQYGNRVIKVRDGKLCE